MCLVSIIKPRRRRDDTEVADRRAFRLCIHADDRERLLDAAIWPNSVVVTDWYFKPQQNNQQNNQGDEQSNQILPLSLARLPRLTDVHDHLREYSVEKLYDQLPRCHHDGAAV